MGVHVEKSSLSDDVMMHEDTPLTRARDHGAMEVVVFKAAAAAPRMYTHEWNDHKRFDIRRVEHVHVSTAHRAPRRMPLEEAETSRYFRSTGMGISRKRPLCEADVRPIKYVKLSPCKLLSSQQFVHDHVDSEVETLDEEAPRLRTLHYALPGLSSHQTLEILGELVSAGHELSWLNSTRPTDNAIIPVFGWRAAVWTIPTPKGNDAVVYKSAKAFEGVAMHDIARKMWMWQGSKNFPELSAPEQVYAVSNEIRIVRQEDCLHGRQRRSSLWLECIRDQGESILLVRKQLHHFQDSISDHHSSPSERECYGYILHPLLVPMRSRIVAGTALHSIGSLRSRDLSTQNQINHIVADMPRHVLQWEDCFVHDTSRL